MQSFFKTRVFLRTLIGLPYEKWNGGPIPRDGSSPFFVSFSSITMDDICQIPSCNCAGLINLLTRFLGHTVPGLECETMAWPGGTHAWFLHLSPFLEPFHPDLPGKAGTLLLRPYTSKEDQGHLAILMEDAPSMMEAPVLHSHSLAGVTLDPSVLMAHSWENGDYFKWVCSWEDFQHSFSISVNDLQEGPREPQR